MTRPALTEIGSPTGSHQKPDPPCSSESGPGPLHGRLPSCCANSIRRCGRGYLSHCEHGVLPTIKQATIGSAEQRSDVGLCPPTALVADGQPRCRRAPTLDFGTANAVGLPNGQKLARVRIRRKSLSSFDIHGLLLYQACFLIRADGAFANR